MCIIESLIFAKISNIGCAFAPGIQELCPGFVENEIQLCIEPPTRPFWKSVVRLSTNIYLNRNTE